MRIIRKIFKLREINVLIMIFVFIIVLLLINPNFSSKINLFGIVYYISENLIMIGAITIILVSGYFDLSIGSILGFSTILVGLLIMKTGLPVPIAILITLIISSLIGSFNGLIIAYGGVNPFITTLATWFILISLKYIINKGNNVDNLPKSLTVIAQYRIFGFPMIFIFGLFCFIIFDILLRKNVYFRQNYAIGGDERSAVTLGVKVKKIVFFNYTILGFMGGLAGIFAAARFGGSYTTAGTDTAFILAIGAIIGGASLQGGQGTVLGSAVGLLFMAIFYDIIVLFKLSLFWNEVTLGLILVLTVLVNSIIEKRRKLITG